VSCCGTRSGIARLSLRIALGDVALIHIIETVRRHEWALSTSS
jgi:hypothetical protein